MEIKQTGPLKVFYRTFETTLSEINTFVGSKPKEIKKEAIEMGLEITGPQIWCYYGTDGNPKTKFKLDIAFPVKEEKKTDPGKFKILEPFTCATTRLEGSWDNLKGCYASLIGDIIRNGHTVSKTCREIYINCDFENPDNNITEVQVGIN